MADAKEVPLFIPDVQSIADGEIDEWDCASNSSYVPSHMDAERFQANSPRSQRVPPLGPPETVPALPYRSQSHKYRSAALIVSWNIGSHVSVRSHTRPHEWAEPHLPRHPLADLYRRRRTRVVPC